MDPSHPNRFPTSGAGGSGGAGGGSGSGGGETSSTLVASESGNNFDDNEGGEEYAGGEEEYLEERKRSASADKRRVQLQQQQQRKMTAPPSSSKSPMSSQQSARASSIASQNPSQQRPSSQQQQQPPQIVRSRPSPHHMSRQQIYEYEQQQQQQNDDDDEEEEDDDDEQDESYPLSMPTHPNYQQARLAAQQQQQKMASMMKKPEIGFKTGNSANSSNNINMSGGGGGGLVRQPSTTGPPYQSSLKPSAHTANKPTSMGNYGSGYEINEKDGKIDLWGHLLVGLSYFFLIVSFPFSLCACVKVAQEYERAVIFRLGRILAGGAKGPGIFFVLPCIDTYTKVDLRTVTFDVPPQEILTKDSVTVSVDAVVYFRIFNAVISVINVEDAAKSTKLLAASTLRNILGTKSLHEILSDRESVAILIQNNLDEATGPWGVKVERVEVKDVRLPVQLQRAMATEAEAAREARAKVIAAEGEQKASKALKEAAEVISESPIAIQLRYLQTLTQIASEKNSTIVFPIPLEMLSFLANKTAGIFKIKN